jgi:DNA invertase Pin-like site-specific DNA recombinase
LPTSSTPPAQQGRWFFYVFTALAEFEKNLIRERTMAGLKAAHARGKSSGRLPKLSDKELVMAKALMADKSNPVAEIAKRFGVTAPPSTGLRNRRACC